MAYTKESETNIAAFFEVNRNEKLENVIISKLNSDMIYTCPNCNKDVILLIRNNSEDNDCAFEISLAAVDQVKELTGENSQISEDIMEFVNINRSKIVNELHELSPNCDVVNMNITNNNKNDIKEIYTSSQEDINHTDSYITLDNINVSYESNKGLKRKFQESVSSKTSINSIKLQKLEERLDVVEQDANELNNDYDTPSITDLITFQPINNSIESPSENIEVQEENNTEYMVEKEHSDKNLIQPQTLEIKSDTKKQNESDSDYDRSSIAGLITFQPENNDDDGIEYVSGDTEIENGNAIDEMTKIEEECVNKDDTNDTDIPKSNEKQVCNLCGACYISQVKYQFHMERHTLNKIDKYVCLICDKETKNENLLWDHYLYTHKSTTRYICLDCNRAFTRKPYLNVHQKRQRHTGYKKTLKVDTDEDNNQTQNDIKKLKKKRKCTVCRRLIKDVDPNAVNDLRMCTSCEESSGYLIVDGVAKMISQRQYHCLKCRKHFMRRERLEFHEMRHNENMDEFICSTCGKEFSGENSLYEHYLFVHKGARPHICDVCGKSFQLKARLKEHLRKHTGELPYQCEICGLRCMTTHALKFHKRSHFSTRHTCEICDKSFIKKQNLNEHLEKHWKKDKNILLPQIFTCPICNCELPTFRMLKHHMLGSHQLERHDPLIMKQKPLYECNECQEKFKHQMSLKAHKEKVHEGKGMPPRTFQCDVCKAEYKAKQMLINHIKSKHSNEKQYECAQCNKRFADVKTLYRHILLHTNRKPFTCEYCNMSFRRKDIRDVHRRKHTNDRPYQCTDCNKSFSSYSSRSKHRKKVHGDNETECPECKAKCGDIQEIRIHLNKHLGEKLSKLESK